VKDFSDYRKNYSKLSWNWWTRRRCFRIFFWMEFKVKIL